MYPISMFLAKSEKYYNFSSEYNHFIAMKYCSILHGHVCVIWTNHTLDCLLNILVSYVEHLKGAMLTSKHRLYRKVFLLINFIVYSSSIPNFKTTFFLLLNRLI